MRTTRFYLRISCLIATILLLVYLGKKPGVNLQTIAQFKYETLTKVKSDSLDTRARLDTLIHQTNAFSNRISEDASHARAAIGLLVGILMLFIGSEIFFHYRTKQIQS